MARSVHARTLPDPRPSRRGLLSSVLLAVALCGSGGCVPDRLVLNLTAADRDLAESVVLSDPHASSKIALIHVGGFLVDARVPGLLSVGQSPVDELVSRLGLAERDPAVRAIVIRVNSPGGTVTSSAVMAREIRRFAERTKKPVVASMGEIAASGGFYVSLAADRVLAEPTTITGSIGVIIQTFNFSSGMEKIGIRARALTSGANKDLANPFLRERESQFGVLQGMVDDFYAGFREHVVTRRPGFDAIAHADLLDGRVMTGADAASVGLIDGLGGTREAFEEAKRLAGVSASRLVTYHDAATDARTPYATSSGISGAPTGERDVTLLRIDTGGLLAGSGLAGGFCYLWTPSAP